MARTAAPRPAAEDIPFTVTHRTPIVTVCPQTGKENSVRGITWEELNESGLLAEQVDPANPPTVNVLSREVRYRLTHVPVPLTAEQKEAQKARNAARRERVNRALALLAEMEASGETSENGADDDDA